MSIPDHIVGPLVVPPGNGGYPTKAGLRVDTRGRANQGAP